MVSGVVADKFATTGLTAVSSELVNAPYVQEFPFNLECRLLHSSDLGSHTQFIGRICDVKADEAVLDTQGVPLAGLVQPLLASAPERSYYALGPQLARTAYRRQGASV
jgi:flavin reductase (DIM6/NTAB) family NADH-FMN oxidoreductase RutF